MFGKCKAFLQSDEEQGRFTLHDHYFLWVGGFDEIRELFFDQDPLRRQLACDEICYYSNKCFCFDNKYIQNHT